jgi:hypothetical protein
MAPTPITPSIHLGSSNSKTGDAPNRALTGSHYRLSEWLSRGVLAASLVFVGAIVLGMI